VQTRQLEAFPMAAQVSLPHGATLEERLELGELIFFPTCPFSLPDGDDRTFLFTQRQNRHHKNINFNPNSGRLSGFCWQSEENTNRLRHLLCTFGEGATNWLAGVLPNYAGGWQRDRVTLRPEEEAIRPLRRTARNDLLHLDAFPNRPTQGARILRLFVNIHPAESRVWATADTFAELIARFGSQLDRHSGRSWTHRLLSLFDPHRRVRSDYDNFMLRLHHFLKSNDAFQEGCRKRYWKFPPGSAWLVFTDGVSHAELRGRYALEHSFLIPRSCLALPDQAPAALFERACHATPPRKAA
jgi:hypothetical protein